MMQLATIASFVVLLCGLFGTTTAANNNQNTMTGYDVASLINDLSNSCVLGVKSVSIVRFTSNNPNGTTVAENDFCNDTDTSKPVIFLTHGFLATTTNYNFSDLISVLLGRGNTVYSLDWNNASCYNDPNTLNLLEYPFAVYNTREVGDHLAGYVKTVIDVCRIPLKNITLMGHSLGAHISGFAAKNLTETNYGKIPLLIGCDPAAPGFGLTLLVPCKERFCKEDASRVIALHTSELGLQYSEIADLNLWFNNGRSQPECGGCLTGRLNLNCSHNECIKYLITMYDCVYNGFTALPRTQVSSLLEDCCCDTTAPSIDVNYTTFNSSITGDYCVSVSSEYPYCIKDDTKCDKLVPSVPRIL